MTSSYRYISFCTPTIANLSQNPPVHVAALQDDQLILKGSDPTKSAGFALLERLITQARTQEWIHYLDTELKSDMRASKASAAHMQDLLEMLKSLDYAVIAQHSKRLLDQEQLQFEHLPPGRDRQLIHAAQRIMARHTVFVLPTYKSQIPAEHPCIEMFSTLLYQSLEGGNETIGILRGTKGDSASGPNIHDEVMQNLLMSTSSLALSEHRAQKPGPILIAGQTGTGKSMGARQIARKLKKRFVTLNLAAVTEELLESRIRGHKKGAFTGATEDSQGVFELADGAVLFLDELQSASLPAQTQLLDLLSAISDRVSISPMGKEGAPRQLNVKLILAVNRPLSELLEEGKLRYDLFHRVRNVVRLPSLKQRFDGHNPQSQTNPYPTASSTTGLHNNTQANFQFIRALLTLYRWNWQDSVDITDLFDKTSEVALPQPFFRISNEALACISSFDWPGNFRQFERFCHDLFEDAKLRSNDEIDDTLISTLLKEERTREGHETTVADPQAHTQEQQKLSYVQRVLIKNRYVISRSLSELTHLKLKSRAALRAYLLQNEDILEPQVREHTAIAAFLHGKRG